MIYVSGANSLNNEVILDINSMERGLFHASGNSKLKIVVLADKQKSYGSESWTGTRLYEILPNDSPEYPDKIYSKVIPFASNSLGLWRDNPEKEEDMGNIKTLENFVLWATENYPYYKKHALILWNHGGGVYSDYKPNYFICGDEESGEIFESLDNALYIGEISELLDKCFTSENKLDFLGFDACFMGMYEIAYQFRNSVKYMAFSPATEWGGWNYEYIFSQDDSYLSGKNFAINVVNGYKDAYNNKYPNTMTAVDLQFASELKENIDNLSYYLGLEFEQDSTKTRDNFIKLQNYAVALHEKNKYFQENLLNYPYFELGSLLDCFSNKNETLKSKVIFSFEVEHASLKTKYTLQKMVLKTWLGGNYGKSYFVKSQSDSSSVFEENIPYGISIFFSNKKNFSSQGFYSSEKTGTEGVLGYGCIEAANKTDNGKIDTWYELQCALYE